MNEYEYLEYYFTQLGSERNYDLMCGILSRYELPSDVLSARYGYEGVAGFSYDWCNWYLNLHLDLDMMCFVIKAGEEE